MRYVLLVLVFLLSCTHDSRLGRVFDATDRHNACLQDIADLLGEDSINGGDHDWSAYARYCWDKVR